MNICVVLLSAGFQSRIEKINVILIPLWLGPNFKEWSLWNLPFTLNFTRKGLFGFPLFSWARHSKGSSIWKFRYVSSGNFFWISSLIYFHQLSLLCCFWNSIIWKSFYYYLSFLRWFSNFLFCCFYFFWATSWGISATLRSGPSLGVFFLSFCYCIFNFYELSFVPEHYIFVVSCSFFMAVRSSVICLREKDFGFVFFSLQCLFLSISFFPAGFSLCCMSGSPQMSGALRLTTLI